MSEEALNVLREKRADLILQIQALHSEVYHIDAAIRLLGGGRERKQNRMFAAGELMRLIGDAERAGSATHREIAMHIIRAKKLDATDRALINRVRWSVSECRKRLNAKGA